MCSEQGPETTRIRDRDPSSTVYSTTKNVVENTENIKTDRQTDGQTDRRNKYILGLPSLKTTFGISVEFLFSVDA